MTKEIKPMFVCHANCCRSVLAYYLYRHIGFDALAFSGGFEPGQKINHVALSMLKLWGIDASEHKPQKIDRQSCEEATAIFTMGSKYTFRLVKELGFDLANKVYLFADPFTHPKSFRSNQYLVYDPSFDNRSAEELVREFDWMRERVLQIRQALGGDGHSLIPATMYWQLLTSTNS